MPYQKFRFRSNQKFGHFLTSSFIAAAGALHCDHVARHVFHKDCARSFLVSLLDVDYSAAATYCAKSVKPSVFTSGGLAPPWVYVPFGLRVWSQVALSRIDLRAFSPRFLQRLRTSSLKSVVYQREAHFHRAHINLPRRSEISRRKLMLFFLFGSARGLRGSRSMH